MEALALTADQVAKLVSYTDAHNNGRGDRIRELWRDGRFPAPIDPDLPVTQLRWSRYMVEKYCAGEWFGLLITEAAS